MYATKRRRRNVKSLKSSSKDASSLAKSNPSKRHRERLNSELELLASLLPFEQTVIAKLDKLSILRLAVSYLRTKTYFSGGQVVCYRGQFPCRGGRCIHYVRVCDGNNDCGDNSDEDAYYCRNSARWRARRCARAIYDECVASMYPGVGVSSIAQTIANTHLSQTCRKVMNATGCTSRVMTSSACQFRSYHHRHPWVIEQNTVNAANTTANYICRDNFQVFAEHKDCLMRSGERELLQIADTVNRQCRPPHVSPGDIFPCGISPTSAFVGCVTNAVTQQCGQQISGHLLTLYTTVVNDANCPSRQYSKLMKKEMNSPLELMHVALASLF